MNDKLTKRSMGIAAYVCALALLSLFVYSLFWILPLITSPPSILNNPTLMADDKRFAAYIVSLEYESFALRLHGTQIALGFVVGLFFSTLGMILLAAGITGDVSVDGQQQEAKISLKGLTPGLVVLICGAALIGLAESKKLTRSFDASYSGKALQTTIQVPKSGVGNETRSDD